VRGGGGGPSSLRAFRARLTQQLTRKTLPSLRASILGLLIFTQFLFLFQSKIPLRISFACVSISSSYRTAFLLGVYESRPFFF